MKKLKRASATSQIEPEVMIPAIDTFLPQHPALVVALSDVSKDISLLGVKEVVTVKRLRGKYWKAPGPNEILNLVWGFLHKASPLLLVDMFNKALNKRVSCTVEKIQIGIHREEEYGALLAVFIPATMFE